MRGPPPRAAAEHRKYAVPQSDTLRHRRRMTLSAVREQNVTISGAGREPEVPDQSSRHPVTHEAVCPQRTDSRASLRIQTQPDGGGRRRRPAAACARTEQDGSSAANSVGQGQSAVSALSPPLMIPILSDPNGAQHRLVVKSWAGKWAEK